MSAIALILVAVAAAPAAAIILLTWRLGHQAANLHLTAFWIDELSVERYRPMSRLLDDAELRFLCSHSDITPKLAAQFRRQRSAIFRGYLRSLTIDFERVLAALKLLMAHATTDRPDLASVLIRSQVSFAGSMILIQVQLMLYDFGIGQVNVAHLLSTFERTRLELRTLIPVAMDPPM